MIFQFHNSSNVDTFIDTAQIITVSYYKSTIPTITVRLLNGHTLEAHYKEDEAGAKKAFNILLNDLRMRAGESNVSSI